jgi:hypothetical protein
MATLEGREPISNIKGIATADNSLYLLSDRIASLNFDGFIPRDNTLVYASDLTPGQTVFTSDPTARDNSLFITRIDTKTVTVESVEETSYLLYYLGDNDLESPYTYGATNVDGSFSQNHLFNVYVDDISDVALGTTGWMMTNQGNAVFSNVFVRGTIEATSGQIDGILKVGESSEGDPLVTIGKNIFSSTPFEGSSGEHSGLFLNKNNYLLGYNVPTNIPITSIVVSDSTGTDYLRKATFTLAGHTLALNDLVSISGFDDDKFIELDNVFPVKEITTDTFTVYYKNPISGTTNPISANLKAESFALNNIYDITSFSLSETTSSTTTSSVNVYLDTNFITLFLQDQVINLNSIINSSLLAANGVHKIVSVTNLTDQDNSYFTITTRRITAGTYTTDLGQITLFNSNYKFKVGDSDNSMSYNSFTGALTVTGRINANSGNFTNTVSIGEPNIFYSVSNKQLLNNEAILTTSTPHSFVVGDSVVITGVDDTFNGTYTVTVVPTEETFIYSKTADPVTSSPVSPVGTVSRGAPVDGTLLVGYGSNQITINGTGLDSTSAIYAGVGNWGESDTGFFMDASGRFSLKDKLKFTTEGDLTVSGTINASAGNFTGFVTAGNMKIGKDVESTNDGVYINSTNYWYDDGKFSLGSGTKKIYFDGTDVKITSDVIIEGGLTTTSLTVGTSPNQMIMSPTAIPGSPSNIPGLYITKTKDFISATTGNFSLGQTAIVWDGTTLNVNGILTGYINQTYAAPIIPANTMGVGSFKNFTNISGTLSGTTLTVSESDRLKLSIGSTLTKVSGTGVFGTSTVVESILSSTEVKVNPISTTNGAIVFNSNNAADEVYGVGLKINQYNYWFADSPGPRIRVGDNTNFLRYESGNLTVSGAINATSGNFTNTVYVGNSETASNNIQLIGTSTAATTAIGIGAGTLEFNSPTTKFWADASGRFSLGNNFSFNGSGISISGGNSTNSTFLNTTPTPTVTVDVNGGEGDIFIYAGSGVNFITSGFFVGMFISGAGISASTIITEVTETILTVNNPLFDTCSSITGSKYSFSTGGSTLENGLFSVDYSGNVKATTGKFGRFNANEDGFSGDNDPGEWLLFGKTSISIINKTDDARSLEPGIKILNTKPISYYQVIARSANSVLVSPGQYLTTFTITTSEPHNYTVGAEDPPIFIKVSGVGGFFDGDYLVSAVTSNTISYRRNFTFFYFLATQTVSPAGSVNNLGETNTELRLTKNGISVWGTNSTQPTEISANPVNAGITLTMGTTDAAVGYPYGGNFTVLNGQGDTLIEAGTPYSGGVGGATYPPFFNVLSNILQIDGYYYDSGGTQQLPETSLTGNFTVSGSTNVNGLLRVVTTSGNGADFQSSNTAANVFLITPIEGGVRQTANQIYFNGTSQQWITEGDFNGANSTEMSYLAGVTSAIQTQLNGKLGTTAKAADSNLLDGINSTSFLRSDASDSWAAATLTLKPDGATYGLVFDAGFSDTAGDPVLVSNGTAHAYGRIGRPANRMYAGYFSLLYAGTSQITSDIREKTSIENSDLGLDFINMLRPVKYKMINGIKKQVDAEGNPVEDTPGTRWHYGLIAQEVKETLDSYNLDSAMWAVEDFETNPDGRQAISYNQIVSPLIKAVQQLSETVEVLENRLAALES